ncbi:MAG: hypothetical protein AVDCRST_MAG89-4530, partial [uncultured Gemmatimonadetes bacterium]
ADFPHPALRLGSLQGMRERHPPASTELHQAEFGPEPL